MVQISKLHLFSFFREQAFSQLLAKIFCAHFRKILENVIFNTITVLLADFIYNSIILHYSTIPNMRYRRSHHRKSGAKYRKKIRGKGFASLAKLALPFATKAAKYILPGLVSGGAEAGIKKLLGSRRKKSRMYQPVHHGNKPVFIY